MDATVPPLLDVATEPRRGGFWRRWLSAIIDIIIVMLPFQILAAILFSVTAGMIQMDNGFFTLCTSSRDIPQVQLDPPPPHDSNFSRTCHVSFFGATTGAVLTVGRTTREGTMTTTVTQGYLIDKDGKPVNGFTIDWIVWLTLLAYLVIMTWKTGRSLGDRATKLRVVDIADPGAPSVPLYKAFIRYPAMIIGLAPVFALLIWRYFAGNGSADAMFTADTFRWAMILLLVAAAWEIVLIVQVARKKDPYYDRLAGTAVVRV